MKKSVFTFLKGKRSFENKEVRYMVTPDGATITGRGVVSQATTEHAGALDRMLTEKKLINLN